MSSARVRISSARSRQCSGSLMKDVDRVDRASDQSLLVPRFQTCQATVRFVAMCQFHQVHRSKLIRYLHHSMTKSAEITSVLGTMRPSALAVLTLIASSYLSGCCTGRLAGSRREWLVALAARDAVPT